MWFHMDCILRLVFETTRVDLYTQEGIWDYLGNHFDNRQHWKADWCLLRLGHC